MSTTTDRETPTPPAPEGEPEERAAAPRRPDAFVAAVAGLTLLAAAVRFGTLDVQSLGHDEAVTVFEVLRPGFGDTLDLVVSGKEKSPPLYYILAWVWGQAFGFGEVGVRSLSALLGTLTVPVAYRATAELASRRAGVLAAALVALSPHLIWYSQEARSYGLFVLLAMAGLLFFARALRRGRGLDLALWALTAAASLATHYFAAFLLAPQALLLLWRLRSKAAAAAVLAVVAAGGGMLPIALGQNANRPGVFLDAAVHERLVETLGGFMMGARAQVLPSPAGAELLSVALAVAALVLVLVGVVLGTLRAAGPDRRGGAIAAGLFAFTLLLPVALAYVGADLLNPRSMIGALLPALVGTSIGYASPSAGDSPRGARARLVAGGALCAVFAAGTVAIQVSPGLQRQDYRSVAETIGPARPVPRLVITPQQGSPTLQGYLDGVVRRAEPVARRRRPDGDRRGIHTDDIAVVVPMSGRAADRPVGALFPIPGFRRIAVRELDEYAVWSYRTPRRFRIFPDDLRLTDVLDESAIVLVQTAPTTRPSRLERRAPRRPGPRRPPRPPRS